MSCTGSPALHAFTLTAIERVLEIELPASLTATALKRYYRCPPHTPFFTMSTSKGRVKPKRSSNLRNELHFPPCNECPSYDDLDLRYYPDYGPFSSLHWCFLGEFIDASCFARLVIDVLDIEGTTCRVVLRRGRRAQWQTILG